MKKVMIPDTDLVLSGLGYGTANAGLKWDGAEADWMLEAYLAAGGKRDRYGPRLFGLGSRRDCPLRAGDRRLDPPPGKTG